MDNVRHLGLEELESGIKDIRQSPRDQGVVRMIVCRPKTGRREVLTVGELDTVEGLLGDNWLHRGSSKTADGSAHPEMQLNIMNTRVISLLAGSQDRWPLAGDQIYVDLDLSQQNLPAGTQLQLGSAVIEVTRMPHTGCKKFVARFGLEAMKFVNSGLGKQLCLRGINTRVVRSGSFELGDIVSKLA